MTKTIEKYCDFRKLKGKTIVKIDGLEKGSEKVTFHCDDGSIYLMYHERVGCENVYIYKVMSDLDLMRELSDDPWFPKYSIGIKVINARVGGSYSNGNGIRLKDCEWTTYMLKTNKGNVFIEWYGTSNGWHPIAVGFYKVEGGDDDQND